MGGRWEGEEGMGGDGRGWEGKKGGEERGGCMGCLGNRLMNRIG